MSDNKKKVLFILQLYPPIHGASTVGEYIKQSKIINQDISGTYVRISTISKNKNSRLFKVFNLLKLYIKCLYLLISTKYDLVYLAPCASNIGFYKDFGLCLMAKIFNKNVVYHFHDKGISTKKFVNKHTYKLFFRNVKVILSSSTLFYDVEDYVERGNAYFIPYGIPNEISEPIKREGRNAHPIILFFAHMMKEKGVLELLKSCAILKKEGYNFICNFVGGWYDITEASFYSFLQVNELLDNVKYLGPQYGKEKNKVLREADIFAFPTYYKGECFTLGLLEAMKNGLPIITTNEGAITDIIDEGVNGFIVNTNDLNKITPHLKLLIDSETKRISIGSEARVKFEKEFTLAVFEKRMLNIINELLNH